MRIYTRNGDQGETELIGGMRIAKNATRLEAYGTVDELNAVIGVARAASPPEDIDQTLGQLQHTLFDLGADLAATTEDDRREHVISPVIVEKLEQAIDRYQKELPPLESFILPGGTRAAAGLHVARTVCRRAERRLVSLSREPGQDVSPESLAYLNRLGDLLFVLARVVNARADQKDIAWRKEIP